MTKARIADDPAWQAPEVRHRRFSLIWILPVVAVAIAGWLGYTTLAERGPVIEIRFATAAGLEAGKTRIRHHDVELGLIDRVTPSPDLKHVVVLAKMSKMAADHLREGTRFWVVRPRLSLTSFSGLETLVSGSYVEMDPGRGAAQKSFVGLEEPPVVRSDVPGTQFTLMAQKLGSIGVGSPVLYDGLNVGEVAGYKFLGAQRGLRVRIFVRKPYDALITGATRFWSASGISLSAGASGFKLEIDSLEAVLAGGIAFDTPAEAKPQQASAEGTTFPLYEDRAAAQEARYTKHARAILEFDDSVRGLEIGAPVEFRGMNIGRVMRVDLVVDAARHTAKVPVEIEFDLGRVGIINQPPEEEGSGKLVGTLVANGLRAQLRTASLISGQLYVAFDFFPNAPPAQVEATDTYPKLPTMPTQLANVTRSVDRVLEKLADLPLDDLLQEIRKLIVVAQSVVGGPEVTQSLKSLEATLGATERITRDVQQQAAPLVANLRRVSESADIAVKRADTTLASMNSGYGRDSQVRSDLADLLKQLQETARSIRWLASYLEQHPEAVVRGKAGRNDR